VYWSNWYLSVGHGPAHQKLHPPWDHSNVNHSSSLILSNACIKPLAYHPIAQRHYNDLLYKLKKKTKFPIGPASIRKGKFPEDIIQAM
jgi:hypothetical protein